MGDAEAGEPGLRLAAPAGRAFVADLTARAGRRAGIRRDGRRVIVRLHLDEDVHRLLARAVHVSRRIRKEPRSRRALEDRGVVTVRREHAEWADLGAAPDELEERGVFRLAVD